MNFIDASSFGTEGVSAPNVRSSDTRVLKAESFDT
jgi:hypothetical protein